VAYQLPLRSLSEGFDRHEVKKDDFGPKFGEGLHTSVSVQRDSRLAAEPLDQHRHDLSRIFVVVNDHDTTALWVLRQSER
jgi:hypothetical protein